MEQVPTAERSSGRAVAVAAYVVLFVLGLLMGLLGAFQHSWYLRPTTVPVSSFGCVLALFAVCYGAGRMMRGKLAALAAASGWLVMTMTWLSGRQEGDVIIAADLSGYVYLYGGMIAALVAVLASPTSHGGSWLLTRH